MRKTTVALALAITLGTALTASPQARTTERTIDPLRCGVMLMATVLDLKDDPGTETTAPTYTVKTVRKATVYFDEGTLLQGASAMARDGVLDGQGLYYPGGRVQKVEIIARCR